MRCGLGKGCLAKKDSKGVGGRSRGGVKCRCSACRRPSRSRVDECGVRVNGRSLGGVWWLGILSTWLGGGTVSWCWQLLLYGFWPGCDGPVSRSDFLRRGCCFIVGNGISYLGVFCTRFGLGGRNKHLWSWFGRRLIRAFEVLINTPITRVLSIALSIVSLHFTGQQDE
jgi:hypothetical protein